MRSSILKIIPTVAAVLTVATVSPQAFAQPSLTTPDNWTKTVVGGDTVFVKSETGNRLVVKKLAPLNGSSVAWFNRAIELDGRSRGELSSGGDVREQKGMMSVVRGYRSSRGSQSVAYMGYPVGNQGRLLILAGTSPMTLLQDVAVMGQVGQQVFDFDKSGSRAKAGAGSVRSGATKPRPSRSVKTPVRSNGKPIQAVKARGTLKSNQITGVFLNESYTTGVGGMMIIQYDPILLLKDGSARRDLEIPPIDVNLAQDKAAHRADWGRWTRQGSKIKVKWSDGESDEVKASFKTRPAKPGETLKRAYSSMGGGGNTAMGGDVMTFYSNSYSFRGDGNFALAKSGGGSSSSISAGSSSKNGGRYRLDGHALTLRFNDGKVVRKLFYFYPNDNKSDVIGIGDDAYIGGD
jgi:hypothetical protein